MTDTKGFEIYKSEHGGVFFKIKNTGSGAVPKSLSGLYTTQTEALKAICAYQPKRGAKKRNAEVDSTT